MERAAAGLIEIPRCQGCVEGTWQIADLVSQQRAGLALAVLLPRGQLQPCLI